METLNTTNIVYRIDSRSPEQIRAAGGFFPRTPGPGRQVNHTLINHFEGAGESYGPDSDVSAFISTSSDIGTVVCHGHRGGVIDEDDDGNLEYDEDFTMYIYEIRPNHSFYNLKPSFEVEIDRLLGIEDLEGANLVYNTAVNYLGMSEYASYGGFEFDRIIRSAELSGDLLNRHSLERLQDEAFWDQDSLWTSNPSYNPSYDANTSSPYPYLNMGAATGTVVGVGDIRLPVEETEVYNRGESFIRLCEMDLGAGPSSRPTRSLTQSRRVYGYKIPKNMRLQTLFNDSEYYIRSSIDTSVLVDISNNAPGANVYINRDLYLPNQRWKLSYNKFKKAYRIINAENKNLCLSTNSSNNVIVDTIKDESFGIIRQYWIPEITDDGFYTIKSFAYNDMFLDLSNAQVYPTNNIQIYKGNNTKAQKWEISAKRISVLLDGEYHIKSCLDNSLVLNLSSNRSGSNVNITKNYRYPDQKWKFLYVKDRKAYKIVSSRNEGLALTWESKTNSNVMGYEFKDYKDQFWEIERTNDGFYILKNYYNLSKVLDVEGGKANDGTNIGAYIIHNGDNQKWSIEHVDRPTIPNGVYTISSKLNYKKVLDYTPAPKYNIVITDYMNLKSSDFKIEYSFKKQAYAIYSGEYSNLGIVFQSERGLLKFDTISDDIRGYWFIEYHSDKEGYLIRSAYEQRYVFDLSGSNLANMTNVCSYDVHHRKNQIWNFMPKKESRY